MIKHILFPFDFSQQGFQAIRFVRAMAARHQARVTALGVIPPPWETPLADMPAVVTIDPVDMERDLKSRLDSALGKEFPDIAFETAVRSGDPAIKIAEVTKGSGIDLVMMPTHGCGLFRTLLIGSVTAKVLHDARCPVWTATHTEQQHSRDVPKTILCAVDRTPKSAALLQWAAEFSEGMNADLKFLHVVPKISDWLGLSSERELQEQMRDEARTQMDALQRNAGLRFPVRVAIGEITDTITEEARQEEADLIIIGRGSIAAPFGRLRTHAYGIIKNSPCPVLSI